MKLDFSKKNFKFMCVHLEKGKGNNKIHNDFERGISKLSLAAMVKLFSRNKKIAPPTQVIHNESSLISAVPRLQISNTGVQLQEILLGGGLKSRFADSRARRKDMIDMRVGLISSPAPYFDIATSRNKNN